MKKIILIIMGFFLVGTFFLINFRIDDASQTELALRMTYQDSIKGQAVMIFDESVYSTPATNVYRYVKDGHRVSFNEEIAATYTNNAEKSSIERLGEIEREIDSTMHMFEERESQTEDIALIENKIRKSALELSTAIYEKDFGAMRDGKDKIKSIVNKTDSSLSAEQISSNLDTLKAEKKSIGASIEKGTVIRAKKSGVFVEKVDRYEEQLKPELISQITSETIKNIVTDSSVMTTPSDSGEFAYKIVDNFVWYTAIVVSEAAAQGLKVGKKIELKFPEIYGERVSAKIFSISPVVEGEAVVVCQSNAYVDNLFTIRTTQCELIKKEHTGLAVRVNSIRVLDGVQGVYINNGGIAQFREINILIKDEEIAIIKESENFSKSALKLYDNIVISGNDINAGKLLK